MNREKNSMRWPELPSGGFSGRVAVVTGGAQGIGAACVHALLAQGARVACLDRDVAGFSAVPDPDLRLYPIDVTDARQVHETFSQIACDLGPPSLLVNNAGIVVYGTVTETSEEDWTRVLATNLTGVFLCSRAALGSMQQLGSGAIVNVASVQSMVSQARVAAYTASKSAILGLTRSIAIDYAPAIRCNAVCPGSIDTPMLQRALADDAEALQECIETHLAGRIGTPEEVASLVVYLLSDYAGFITGQAVRIDGGIGLAIGPTPRGTGVR